MSSWRHCHPIISCSSKIQNGLPFWCQLTQVVLEKRPLNGCSNSSSNWSESSSFYLIYVSYAVSFLHQSPQPFYGLFPGPPGWAGARRELLDFMVQGKINRGRHTDHPAGRHSIQSTPFPQIDIIGDVVIVWRVRGKTIRSVLCNIVCNNCAQCDAHTYEQTNSSLDWVLSHWAHFTVLDSFLYCVCMIA